MTAFEIITVIIDIIMLLISFGGLLVTILSFIDKRYKKK